MKKTTISAICALSIISMAVYGNNVCMTSKPYGHRHDYSTPRYVKCYCNCRQYKCLPHGECSYCGHYHYIDELEILTPKQTKIKQAATSRTVMNKKLYKLFGEKEFRPETQRFTQIR